MTARFSAHNITVGYGERTIIENLSVDIPAGKKTTILGPNGCGKSTLLKALSTLLPYQGEILFNEKNIKDMKRKERAHHIAMLPQHPIAPDGLTVSQLVSRGRHPHQSWLRQWSKEDEEHVYAALQATNLTEFADRPIQALSGGQRQRVWIAMTLAQDTETVLLDEPTTYLDLSHSLDVLNLVRDMQDKTVVMVLHDLNMAIRYSDHLICMRDGKVLAEGHPNDIITKELLQEVFNLDAVIIDCPVNGLPLLVPRS